MSTTTFDRAPGAGVGRAASTKSWSRRFWDAFVAARQAQADRAVRTHLTKLDDKGLENLGFSQAEIKALRTGKPMPRGIAR